jgi:hypothetical protein
MFVVGLPVDLAANFLVLTQEKMFMSNKSAPSSGVSLTDAINQAHDSGLTTMSAMGLTFLPSQKRSEPLASSQNSDLDSTRMCQALIASSGPLYVRDLKNQEHLLARIMLVGAEGAAPLVRVNGHGTTEVGVIGSLWLAGKLPDHIIENAQLCPLMDVYSQLSKLCKDQGNDIEAVRAAFFKDAVGVKVAGQRGARAGLVLLPFPAMRNR